MNVTLVYLMTTCCLSSHFLRIALIVGHSSLAGYVTFTLDKICARYIAQSFVLNLELYTFVANFSILLFPIHAYACFSILD